MILNPKSITIPYTRYENLLKCEMLLNELLILGLRDSCIYLTALKNIEEINFDTKIDTLKSIEEEENERS